MTKLKPILRVIDLVGDGRSMTLPVHPKVIARTHCVRFMDTYNGAEATIFMAADGWLMMRRVGNVWVWPPSDDVQAGAMLYAIGELVECNDKGEPVARVTISNRIIDALSAGPMNAFDLCDRLPDVPMYEVRSELERLAHGGEVRTTYVAFRPVVWALAANTAPPRGES